MGEIFIEKEKLQSLLQTAAEKTGIPPERLAEKLAPHLQDGGLVLPPQLGRLFGDPQRLEQLMRSGVLTDLMKKLGGADLRE